LEKFHEGPYTASTSPGDLAAPPPKREAPSNLAPAETETKFGQPRAKRETPRPPGQSSGP